MWEAPEIVGPWIALLDGGWLVREGRRVVPDASADGEARTTGSTGATDGIGATGRAGASSFHPSASEPEEFLRFARAVIVSLIAGLGMRDPEEGGLRGLPGTLVALRAACGPDGAEVRKAAGVEEAATVRMDLEEFVSVGLLRREGEHFTGPAILGAALDEAGRILRNAGRDRGSQ